MPEVPAPRNIVEAPPRAESRPSRETTINAFNHIYTRYEAAMSPLLTRLEAGENLTAEERRNANAFRVTRDGLRNVVGEEHRPGTPAIPDNLGSDEWNNVYRDADGKVLGKQREGIVTNHMLDWIDGEIKNQGSSASAADMMSRDMLRASSGTYAELHSTPGSMDRELRVRQEAGAIIHPDPKRDSTISQDNETDRQAHERDDWQMASDEIDNRLELVLPPLKTNMPNVKVVNPSTVRVDEGETVKVHIPDSDGPAPFRVLPEGPSTVVVDGGGGEVTIPKVEVTSDYVPPVERSIPDRLAPLPEPPGPRIIRPDGFAPYIIDDPKHPSNMDSDAKSTPVLGGEKPFDSLEEGSPETDADAEAEAAARRADRLARLKGMPKAIWNRVQSFVKDRVPSVDLPKIPTIEPPTVPMPGRRFGTAATIALVAVIIANCAGQGGAPASPSKAEPFPGSQYGPKPKVEMVYDRPQLPSVAEADPALAPASVVSPERSSTGKIPDMYWFEDFTGVTGPQYVDGLAKDQLAQTVSPEYYQEVRDARARGEVVDAKLGRAESILNQMKADMILKYGEAQGTAIFNKTVNGYVDKTDQILKAKMNEPFVSVAPDGEIVFKGFPSHLTLPYAKVHGGDLYASAVESITGEKVDPVLPGVKIVSSQ